MIEKRYINEKQVAEITGLALPTLRNDRSLKRRLPYVKIGKSVRYSLQDVYDFMESRKIGPVGA
jgi:predicted DNA-binding transcriptional regulator AlpA